MLRQDAYFWRLAASGLCFAAFGFGGLVLGLIVFPLMRILPGGANGHRLRARRTIQKSFLGFIELTRSLRVLDYEFSGRDRLGRPGQLIVANHPTLIDVVFLLGFTPAASCVVKEAHWHNPFTRWPIRAAQYVSNYPTGEMIESAAAALKDDQSVIMFPEGTRSTPGQSLEFHRGAASIAIRAARMITPVFIRCAPRTLSKSEPWYRIPSRRFRMTLCVGADVELESFRRGAASPAAARALNAHMLEIFTQELAANE